jgi:hypothetical protein
MTDAGPFVLFLTGLFKPMIGVLFALFVFTANHAGIVAIPVGQSNYNAFLFALSFIEGFSERFVRDIATSTAPR